MLTEKQAIRFFDDCLNNRISETDGEKLLRFLEAHPEITRDVYDNLYIDSLLRQRKEDEIEEKDQPNSPGGPENVEENDLFQWVDNLERLAASIPTSAVSHHVPPQSAIPRFRFKIPSVPGAKLLYRNRRLLFFLACFLFFLIGAYGLYHEFLTGGRTPIVAHLTGFDDVVWEGGEIPIELGDPIRKKPLRIRSGSVSLKTLNGADVVLEGPAELRMNSQTNWQLFYGYLSANVPPQSRTLCVKTAQMSIDVLGTEFWVKATEEKSEVHLLRGKLNLHGNTIPSQILNAGDAFSMSSIGETKLFKALESQLLKADTLLAQAEKKWRIRREKTLQTVNREPSLLLYFDFQEFGRTLPNLASHGQSLVDSARIEGCSQISGPMTGEKAVAFRRKSDRMLLKLPKQLESFTLFARIRVDAEVKHRCALLISEASVPGSIQWVIANGGIPVLNICKDQDSVFENFAAPKVFCGQNLRRWKAIAVVYDATAKRVDWYLDGELLSSSEMKESIAVMINYGMIGNWARSNDVLAPGAGFGLSELRLYERALAAEEILQLNHQ